MNPFRNSSSIQIRITRDDDPQRDDRIAIVPKDENYYQLFFQDGDSKVNAAQTYCTVLTGEQLDVYMDSLFTLLVRDNDPFKNINFMIPCFPVVQYDIQDLRKSKLRNTLQRLLPILQSAAKY